MAGRDGTSGNPKEGVDFKWITNPNTNVKTRKFFTKAEKEAMKAPKAEAKSAAKPAKPTPRASTKSAPKPDLISRAAEAIDRSDPTRPRSRPGTTRPQARREGGPDAKTATSVETPKVTSSSLGKSTTSPSEGSSSSAKPFAGTKPTRAEWDKMTAGQRVRWGVVLPPRASGSEGDKPTPKAGRRGARSRGYSKGGMVQANCGASMKPTQKNTRKK